MSLELLGHILTTFKSFTIKCFTGCLCYIIIDEFARLFKCISRVADVSSSNIYFLSTGFFG